MRLQLQTRSSRRTRIKTRRPNPALMLLTGIVAVVVGTSGALLVVLAMLFKGRWEPLDLVALAFSLASLMLGLQLLSWSVYGQQGNR